MMRFILMFFILTTTLFAVAVSSSSPICAAAETRPLDVAFFPPPPADEATSFQLSDQFGGATKIEFPRDKPTILVFGDREGASQIEGWVRPVYEKYTDKVDVYGIAELSAVPNLARGVVRRIMKSRSKYPVMLDWSGKVSKAYGYESGKATLVLIDRKGNIVGKLSGAATAAELENLYRAVNRVL